MNYIIKKFRRILASNLHLRSNEKVYKNSHVIKMVQYFKIIDFIKRYCKFAVKT